MKKHHADLIVEIITQRDDANEKYVALAQKHIKLLQEHHDLLLKHNETLKELHELIAKHNTDMVFNA